MRRGQSGAGADRLQLRGPWPCDLPASPRIRCSAIGLAVSQHHLSEPTAAPVVARLSYSPTLTIENPVLADPALIDPSTGLPFGGSLVTGMTSSERFEVPLAPGQQLFERSRDSAVCIAGFMSRKTLMLTYGLSEAQAKDSSRSRPRCASTSAAPRSTWTTRRCITACVSSAIECRHPAPACGAPCAS